jgi:hypothetical protein
MTSKAHNSGATERGKRRAVYFGLVAFQGSMSNPQVTIVTSWAEQRFDRMNRKR